MSSEISPYLAPAYDDSELPSYTRFARAAQVISFSQTKHVYHMTKNSGHQWLTLTVYSKAAQAESPPFILEGEVISGSVKLDLVKEEAIRSVSITVFGQLFTSSRDWHNFMTIRRTLWSSADPATGAAEGISSYSSKLKGQYNWPFAIKLPAGVVIGAGSFGSEGVKFRLPPSIAERKGSGHIRYEIMVLVKRANLRTNGKLMRAFEYSPVTRPAPPSLMRQLAYQERRSLVGPDGDPDGWKSLTTTMHGTVFKTRPVDIECTFSLATPLCYTRGTPLPLKLAFSADDAQALDLVTITSSIVVHLVQRASFSMAVMGGSGTLAVLPGEEYRIISTAVWWRSPLMESTPVSNHRILDGEIHVPEQLPPNCSMITFKLEYLVQLLPSTPVGFTPTGPTKEPLLSEVVEIATDFASGPQPHSFIQSAAS